MSSPINIPNSSKQRTLSEQFEAESAESKQRIIDMIGTKPTSKSTKDESERDDEVKRRHTMIKKSTSPDTRSMLKHYGVYKSPSNQ